MEDIAIKMETLGLSNVTLKLAHVHKFLKILFYYYFSDESYLFGTRIYLCLFNNLATDCAWGDWTIGTCSVTCGVGIRIDTREKTIEESNGGRCDGCETRIDECSKEDCPSM